MQLRGGLIMENGGYGENGINIFNNIKQSIINGVLLVDLSDDKPFLQ